MDCLELEIIHNHSDGVDYKWAIIKLQPLGKIYNYLFWLLHSICSLYLPFDLWNIAIISRRTTLEHTLIQKKSRPILRMLHFPPRSRMWSIQHECYDNVFNAKVQIHAYIARPNLGQETTAVQSIAIKISIRVVSSQTPFQSLPESPWPPGCQWRPQQFKGQTSSIWKGAILFISNRKWINHKRP